MSFMGLSGYSAAIAGVPIRARNKQMLDRINLQVFIATPELGVVIEV
jgi:hypothetical protein